jgi:hypothetical protein
VPLADPDELWPELEVLGEDEVRRRLALQTYGHTKLPAVLEWLRRKEQERIAAAEQRHSAQRLEELSILRSTKHAAWGAAIAAVITAIFALVALFGKR